jgi:hypothetical protein
MSLKMGQDVIVPFSIPQTQLLAGTPIDVVAPVDGYLKEAYTIVDTAVTTGGQITFKVGTTTVAGMSLTVADAAAKGDVDGPAVPTSGSSTRAVSKGDRLQIIPAAAFDTAGALNGHLVINTAQ